MFAIWVSPPVSCENVQFILTVSLQLSFYEFLVFLQTNKKQKIFSAKVEKSNDNCA